MQMACYIKNTTGFLKLDRTPVSGAEDINLSGSTLTVTSR
jgi:hypothetical protein